MLNQGKPLSRKTPMRRSAIARKSAAPKMTAGQKPKPRRKVKHRPGRDQTALDACRGEQCYLRIAGVCLGGTGADTVVPAHSNQGMHGKGKGIKAFDRFTVPACYACHAEIDSGNRMTRAEKTLAWASAYFDWEPVRAQKISALGKAIAELPVSKVVQRTFTTAEQPSTEAIA